MKFDENSLEANLEKSLEQFLNDENLESQKSETAQAQEEQEPPKEQEALEEEQPKPAPEEKAQEAEEELSMEEKINLAMKKIMVETLGELPEEEEEPPMPAKTGSAKKKIIAILCSFLLVFGIGAYGIYGYSQKDVFFRGTKINNIDCGGLTVEETENRIRQGIEGYTIQLGFRNGQKESIQGTDIGVRYKSDGSIQKIKDNQNPMLWLKGYFSPETYEVAEDFTFEKAKLQDTLESFSPMKSSNMQAPQNADIFFENGVFVIKDEVPGTMLRTDEVYRAVSAAISTGEPEVNLDTAAFYQEPEVKRDSAQLQTQLQQLEELVNASITYQLPNAQSLVLDGNLMKQWLTLDAGGNYVKDEAVFDSHLKNFISDMAKKYNTYGNKRKFKPTGLSEIEIEGKYGWKIDEAQELEKLKGNIAAHEIVTREPEYASKESTTENYGFGKSYVEVDLSRQHVWAYVDGELVVSSDCVSGKMVRDRWTPPGIFHLMFKQLDRTLKGKPLPGGGYEYESPVDFWMPFNGGIGFHDADRWRSSYGGEIYINRGSHGCVNMPHSKAEKLYEIITKEMPIIVYYSQPYTVKETPPAAPTPSPKSPS